MDAKHAEPDMLPSLALHETWPIPSDRLAVGQPHIRCCLSEGHQWWLREDVEEASKWYGFFCPNSRRSINSLLENPIKSCAPFFSASIRECLCGGWDGQGVGQAQHGAENGIRQREAGKVDSTVRGSVHGKVSFYVHISGLQLAHDFQLSGHGFAHARECFPTVSLSAAASAAKRVKWSVSNLSRILTFFVDFMDFPWISFHSTFQSSHLLQHRHHTYCPFGLSFLWQNKFGSLPSNANFRPLTPGTWPDTFARWGPS